MAPTSQLKKQISFFVKTIEQNQLPFWQTPSSVTNINLLKISNNGTDEKIVRWYNGLCITSHGVRK